MVIEFNKGLSEELRRLGIMKPEESEIIDVVSVENITNSLVSKLAVSKTSETERLEIAGKLADSLKMIDNLLDVNDTKEFYKWLQRYAESEFSVIDTADHISPEPSRRSRPLAIVAHPDETLCDILADLLEDEGINSIRGYWCAPAALLLTYVYHPDFIVSDVTTCGLDLKNPQNHVSGGFGLRHYLKGDLNTDKIPFIYVSARSDKEALDTANILNAKKYLIIPFETDDFKNTIKSLNLF